MTIPRFQAFTGGPLDTNAFLYKAPQGHILFDAPLGADEAFSREKVDLLFLTHGHFDHVADAAAIRRRHNCQVALHELTIPMVTDRHFFERWGFSLEVEPVKYDRVLGEGDADLLGESVRLFHVPGHCPGSLCVLIPSAGTLVGGDVIFAGGVGRWDLPGGDYEQLMSGIHSKLLPLPPLTRVLPGHGPATTIGEEAATNPYLQK